MNIVKQFFQTIFIIFIKNKAKSLSFGPSQGNNSVNIGRKTTSRTIFETREHLAPRLMGFFALLWEI